MNTGVQRVVRELFRSLAAIAPVIPLIWDPGLRSYCTLSSHERNFLERPFAAGTAPDAEPGRRANPVPFWSKFVRRFVHRRNRLDLVTVLRATDTLFVPEIYQDNRVEWLSALANHTSARRVAVCHDAIAWRRPELSPPAREAGFAPYLDSLATFDHVIAISQETSDDLHAFWRERGRTTFPPVSVHPWPVNHAGTPRPVVTPPTDTLRPAILCVGTFEPRKNHLVLLEAARQLWERDVDFELILVGRTTAHWGVRVVTALESLQAANHPVRWLRHVDDQTLRRAYEQCAFTVFPIIGRRLRSADPRKPLVRTPLYLRKKRRTRRSIGGWGMPVSRPDRSGGVSYSDGATLARPSTASTTPGPGPTTHLRHLGNAVSGNSFSTDLHSVAALEHVPFTSAFRL